SVVLRIMLVALVPGAADLDTNRFLGLSTLGGISFVSLWVIQVIIGSYGMEMIRRYEAFAGQVILITMGSLARWMLSNA
ncbi:NCS1 family nucleobase:cation symporter-1, partial [Gordonia amicalis]|nr:NCS1 family nucleobase:cation symporter-1 [Gordonia amicalis]